MLVPRSVRRSVVGARNAPCSTTLVTAVRAGDSRALRAARRGGRRQDRAAGATCVDAGLGLPRRRARRASSPRWSSPFAGLHQLCAPMLDRLERLPGPQRDALGTAFGLHAGRRAGSLPRRARRAEPARRRRRGAAAGLRRRRRAVARPRVGADARVRRAPPAAPSRSRWSSRCASRATSDELAGLPELVVERPRRRRCPRAARRRRCTGPLDERVRDRIVAETRGNPLALLELPRGLTPAELAGGFGLPDAVPLPSRIEESFRATARARSRRRRSGCCWSRRPSRSATRRCSGARPSASASASRRPRRPTAAGLIEIGARVRFRHPLVRSAVYRAAAPRRAAGASTARWPRRPIPTLDPDRRAWHRAHAADGPGRGRGRRARALRRPGAGARRAGRGGGVPRARRRADARTRPRRAARALAAAQAKHHAGAPDAALAAARDGARPGRSTSSSAPRSTCSGRRSRSRSARGRDAPPLLLERRPAARAARRDAGARDLPRRVRGGALRRAA